MKIEGKNAVQEAINSSITIDRLAVQKGLKDFVSQKIIDNATHRGIKVLFLSKEAMDRESRTGRHQGFIADVTDFVYTPFEEMIAKTEGKERFFLLLDGVEDPHNLGSILRVAECGGVSGVVIPERRSVSVNETVIKVSAGAATHVKVAKVTNINNAIDTLKKAGVWVYCADMDGKSIYDTDLRGDVALVVGGEGSGVGKRTHSNCDGVVSIPMMGKVNSLNASVAAGIVVFEKIRQQRSE
jgi:23S rRNA (guanosine2251-2'-O)-methyltransferase